MSLNEFQGQIVIDGLLKDGDKDDVCPKFNVHCSKDGENVGDLGKKDYCRSGIQCYQARGSSRSR